MKLFRLQVTLVASAFSALACGQAAGTHPHDMSAASHEDAAGHEADAADAHEEEYDPSARQERGKCGTAEDTGAPICWTEVVNPTETHQEIADKHRKIAKQHRQASEELRKAEASACQGVAHDDRDMSPFLHSSDIRSVRPLSSASQDRKATYAGRDSGGATIVVNAVPSLTKEWLQRVVNCHLARNAALGHESAEMPYCPLVPKDVRAAVRALDDGFAVDIAADDQATIDEIWRRAQLIKGRE